MPNKYSFIGVGNMAGAIIGGLLAEGVPNSQICLYDPNPAQYDRFPGCPTAKNACEAVDFADFVFLCVKPQNFSVPLDEIRSQGIQFSGKTLISIVTGISMQKLCDTLGSDVPVVRVMPNTPMLIGCGVAAMTRNHLVSDDSYKTITSLFESLGRVVQLDESKMNDIIAVTASSPAYVFLFIKAMADAAEQYGFDQKEMLGVFCDAVIGSAQLCKGSEKTPDELIKMVCSPGGTTLAAMDVFEKNGFVNIIAEAMDACTKRAYELAEGK